MENVPIFMRVSFGSTRIKLSTGYKIDLDKWDDKAQRVKRNCMNKSLQSYTYYLTSAGDLKYSDKPRTLKTFRIFFRFFADNADAGALDFNLDFGDGNQTGIVELDGNGRDTPAHEGYFNLQGLKYNEQPLQKGIYINNGHKVVVK